MVVIDDDCEKAFTNEEVRGETSVIGYGQSKVGGWDTEDIVKPEETAVEERESSSEAEEHEEEEEKPQEQTPPASSHARARTPRSRKGSPK